MESISVFDIFKIGVGPSSSHTMGPWRAAQRFLSLRELDRVESVQVHLYGSLAKTGRGHGTDIAVLMGLLNADPETVDVDTIFPTLASVKSTRKLELGGKHEIPFEFETDIVFHMTTSLPFHSNGLRFVAAVGGEEVEETYYSVGGGFVVLENEVASGARAARLIFPIDRAYDLTVYSERRGLSIPEIVMENEKAWRNEAEIKTQLNRLWTEMLSCAWRGCHTSGILPGGLNVKRRAAEMNLTLFGRTAETPTEWLTLLHEPEKSFDDVLKRVSCFALAINEENANFGRVVTAPTNGAAGVIPAVLIFAVTHYKLDERGIADFILTAGEIGSLFKKGATISAAMGGCQAEIGVSSAMAAAALCQVRGGSAGQVLMAAEIAMEHHLGMTCDPIGGLVQIPCIERNTMGAIKAITAATIALESDPDRAKVSLDDVIATMWKTSLDMNHKYKETAEGGLALQIPVSVAEC